MIKRIIFGIGRKIAKNVPLGHRSRVIAWWFAFCKQAWNVRNLLSNSRSLMIRTRGAPVIQMHAEGHIAWMLWCSYFEVSEREFFAALLNTRMTVINVGANSGLYSVMAGAIVGPEGRVHAFEPSSVNFNRLVRNITLNGLSNVVANSLALSRAAQTLYLRNDPDNPALDSHYYVSTEYDKDAVVQKVRCETLDNYWSTLKEPISEIADVAIIDVEGAEIDVLLGACNLIGSSPDIVLMIECTKSLPEIEAFLRQNGFIIYLWNSSFGFLQEAELKRGNIIAARPTSRHLARIRKHNEIHS